MVVYLNNILVFLDTYKQHVEYIQKVIKALQARNLPLKLGKYEFHKQLVVFLGYIISNKSLGPNLKKV